MSGLPRLDLPRYKHKLVGLNKEIKYRGFTTKEQKILLSAKQDDSVDQMFESIKQIIENCTFGDLDVDALSYFDLEDLFLRIREKSVSDVVELTYNVKDKDGKHLEQIQLSIDLKQIKVQVDPEHTDKIQLSDELGIKMTYPTVDMLKNVNNEMEMLESCIECIYTADEVFYIKDYSKEDYEEFIDSLDVPALKKIKKFFDTMPRLRHEETITLKDGTKETIKFEGLQDFF